MLKAKNAEVGVLRYCYFGKEIVSEVKLVDILPFKLGEFSTIESF